MATEVLMPKLGLTMTEGTIEEWKIKEGEPVKKGDVLFSVATDKLTNDVEADADGVLLKILRPRARPLTARASSPISASPARLFPARLLLPPPLLSLPPQLPLLLLLRHPRLPPPVLRPCWWLAAALAAMWPQSVPHSWVPR